MAKQTIRDADVSGKRVLVRVDFNVPLDKQGRITDDTRIRAALPTIQYLLQHGAAVILVTHLGRPDGKVVDKLRLDPVARRLEELLGGTVIKAPDSVGPEVRQIASGLRPGQVLLLENVRFHPEEEANDAVFARQLAELADVYVDDAFGTAHRAHASTSGVAAYRPAYAGFLMEKEIDTMGRALENPERPFVALIGGAKVSTKIGVLNNLLDKVDRLLIGGAMANTFLRAQAYDTGKSLVEEDKVGLAEELLRKGDEKLLLPVDVVVASKPEAGAETKVVPVSGIPAEMLVVDIGPETIQTYADVVANAKTVVWNGPMGIFEVPEFARGTRAMAEALASSQALSIVGGGDSVAAVEQMGLADKITHVSTGGGASLEFLEGRTLPGVEVLRNAD
ncbi:MAG: phosphoglycerate kinase [Chloroflexi bacterium]|nr:phosphoglycerate kinase [Chloroflexota bacterium]MCL5108854.1 phosphoglycerate kinase [Chloroflexota bacterium]